VFVVRVRPIFRLEVADGPNGPWNKINDYGDEVTAKHYLDLMEGIQRKHHEEMETADISPSSVLEPTPRPAVEATVSEDDPL
jgi:hypothetical protein